MDAKEIIDRLSTELDKIYAKKLLVGVLMILIILYLMVLKVL